MSCLRLPLFLVAGLLLGCPPMQVPLGDETAGDLGGGGGGADVPLMECASGEYDARQQPAALLAVLDRSASMAEGSKWNFAAQAIVHALDQPVFDGMHLGLYAAPSGTVRGPACFFNLPVACQAPPFPQIALKPAGTQRSGDAAGVRREIKSWLEQNTPDNGLGDASPLYLALQAAISALQGWSGDGKRILFVVTDGSISCNQFSTRPGFADCNGCDRDWEDPANIVALLQAANRDPVRPVETFVVGVPGADTYDPMGCSYPPYRMRLALSAIAYAGAPRFVPATCDGRTFSRTGVEPASACHFDFTRGNFSATAVANAIDQVRGQVLGCVFDLPTPEGGAAVDRDRVNVHYTIGGRRVDLARRRAASDSCQERGCWDYTPDGKVELLGRACQDVKGTGGVRVRIALGCATVVS